MRPTQASGWRRVEARFLHRYVCISVRSCVRACVPACVPACVRALAMRESRGCRYLVSVAFLRRDCDVKGKEKTEMIRMQMVQCDYIVIR